MSGGYRSGLTLHIFGKERGGTIGSCLLSPPSGGGDVVPGAELCVGRLANAPASTPEGTCKCMSLKSELDLQLNSGTLHGETNENNSLCTDASIRAGIRIKLFRQVLLQPTRAVRARTDASVGMEAVARLVRGRLTD